MQLPCSATFLAAFLLLPHAAPAAGAAPANQPGAYCPLPKKGEVPRCLAPAQATYGEFFSALDSGAGLDASASAVEQVVAQGARAEEAYLALSSLSYGYYRLAQQALASETEDPAVTARLARWNALLSLAYDESPEDEQYRAAVRLAAEDLHEQASVSLPCRNARGKATECNSTESVLRGFNAASEKVGIRGALERLLRRFFGGEET